MDIDKLAKIRLQDKVYTFSRVYPYITKVQPKDGVIWREFLDLAVTLKLPIDGGNEVDFTEEMAREYGYDAEELFGNARANIGSRFAFREYRFPMLDPVFHSFVAGVRTIRDCKSDPVYGDIEHGGNGATCSCEAMGKLSEAAGGDFLFAPTLDVLVACPMPSGDTRRDCEESVMAAARACIGRDGRNLCHFLTGNVYRYHAEDRTVSVVGMRESLLPRRRGEA